MPVRQEKQLVQKQNEGEEPGCCMPEELEEDGEPKRYQVTKIENGEETTPLHAGPVVARLLCLLV